jgi:hypothetical protein
MLALAIEDATPSCHASKEKALRNLGRRFYGTQPLAERQIAAVALNSMTYLSERNLPQANRSWYTTSTSGLKQSVSFPSAGIAQLVEQLICNQQVVGSNPTAGSSFFR